MASARVGTQSVEVLDNGGPYKRLGFSQVQVLGDVSAAPTRRVGMVQLQAISGPQTIPKTRMATTLIEVLVPAKSAFVGWGQPV